MSVMFRRRKPEWAKLASGLFVPPYLKFAPWYPCPDCCGTNCIHCQTGTAPNQYQIVVAGVGNASCSDCGDFNATWVVDFAGIDGHPCLWTYTLSSTICTATILSIEFFNPGSPQNGSVLVAFEVSLFGTRALHFLKTNVFGAPMDCELSSFSVGGPASSQCNISGATCTVTAL